MPRPTSPMDDAGPLKGKIPPTLISVAVTPGVSAAKADVASARVSAQLNVNALNIGFSSFFDRGRCSKARLLVGSVETGPRSWLDLQFYFRTCQGSSA